MEPEFNSRADALMRKGRFREARELLEQAIREMPAGWTPSRDDGKFLTIAFWNEDEFLAHGRSHAGKSTIWAAPSYSRAWYQLAVVAVEQGQFEQALFSIDCGLDLEPDHPELWCEKGFVLGRLERHQEAYDCFVRAASARDWAPAAYLARALRGQGVELIDLDRLDEAKGALTRSLELEPDSKVARNELQYIDELTHRPEAAAQRLPWFAEALLNPPRDPLTIRLLALVEDMPPIAGPQTVGPENYSRIASAFMEHGWQGFEQEFDRAVPRDRPDYADVKRDLLCEHIFNRKVHRRLTDLFTGKATVEEVFDEIKRNGERKPQ